MINKVMINNDMSSAGQADGIRLVINIAKQTLSIYQHDKEIDRYDISTAKNGIGSLQDSGCTPLGAHIIAEKIGGSLPINTVFVGRVPTGEIYSKALDKQYPERDWILSRILWLAGLEEGRNKGSNSQGVCDTYQRYIYIHGMPDSEPTGIPRSHGCVRMRNQDIMALFEQVKAGTTVQIIAH